MTFNVDTVYYRKAREGQAYIISKLKRNISSGGGTFNIHLKNPQGSGVRFVIVDVHISTTAPYEAMVYDKFSSGPSGGTTMEIQNVLLDTDGSDDDGLGIANQDVSYSNGTSNHAVGVGGGGTGGTSVGGDSAHAPIIIEPGREVVIESTNTSANQENHTITVLYFESSNNN